MVVFNYQGMDSGVNVEEMSEEMVFKFYDKILRAKTMRLLHHYERQFGELTCRVTTNCHCPRVVLFMFHGYGSSAESLQETVDAFFFTYRPHPIMVVTPNGVFDLGDGCYRWWTLTDKQEWKNKLRRFSRETFDIPNELPVARQAAMSAIENACDVFKLSFADIGLAGFSQGSMLALDLFFEFGKTMPPSAVGLFSGSVMAKRYWRAAFYDLPQRNRRAMMKVPVYVAHGSRDPVLPLPLGIYTQRFLSKMHFNVQFQQFSGVRHEIPDEAASAFFDLVTPRVCC